MTDALIVAEALDAFRNPAGRVSPAFGLDHIKAALRRLGDPQDRVPRAVHITGTNGKGSAAAFLRSMAEASGLRVHVFTSPHLTRVNERIRLAGRLVEDEALADALARVKQAGPDLTYFEALTAAAYLLFAETPAELTIVEVGAGGEGDATNVMARPAACVVMPISLDHEAMFGVEGVGAIAGVKAGILRRGVSAVFTAQPAEARLVLERAAQTVGAPVSASGRGWRANWDGAAFVYKGPGLAVRAAWLGLAGLHQAENAGAACAVMEALGLAIEPEILAAGLRETAWPGRLQRLRQGPLIGAAGADWRGALIVDAAHNPAGAETLAQAIRSARPQLGGDKAAVIFACQSTKDIGGMLDALMPAADEVIACRLPDSGGQEGGVAAEPDAIAELVATRGGRRLMADDLRGAVRLAALRGAHRIYVTGSLYLCGAALVLNGEAVS
jgi:dihydrofolate synthase/folylpolyglutamate synthase